MSNSKTRRLTLIAMLSAISFVLSYPMFQFPLVPSASFLKIDFTILPILIGLFMLGLSSAFAILIIRSLLWLLLNSDGVNTYIGLPMNILTVTVFVLVLWFFLRHRFSLRNYIMAAILGTLALTVLQVVLNYVYAIPLYAMFANFDIATMFPMVVFQLILVLLLSLIFYKVSFLQEALLYCIGPSVDQKPSNLLMLKQKNRAYNSGQTERENDHDFLNGHFCFINFSLAFLKTSDILIEVLKRTDRRQLGT